MSHPSNFQNLETLEDLFTHHPAKVDQQERYEKIRRAGKRLAAAILVSCPGCSDRAEAIRKVREAVMTANASIALEAADDDRPKLDRGEDAGLPS